MSRAKLYLAGPAVFFPNAKHLSAQQAELCYHAGFEPLHPLDNDLSPELFESRIALANAIRSANERMIQLCDAVVADLSPFRGPGMDGGTAFEIGYARALGKPVIGYYPDPSTHRSYYERVWQQYGGEGAARRRESPDLDLDGLLIENFGLCDNLMMATSLSFLASSLEEALTWLRLHLPSLLKDRSRNVQ